MSQKELSFAQKYSTKTFLSRFEENILSRGARATQPSWKITQILGVVNTRQVDK